MKRGWRILFSFLIAGICAFYLKKYTEAEKYFKQGYADTKEEAERFGRWLVRLNLVLGNICYYTAIAKFNLGNSNEALAELNLAEKYYLKKYPEDHPALVAVKKLRKRMLEGDSP